MPIDVVITENDTKSFNSAMEAEMTKPIKHFEGELLKIRTGRAHTSLIEDIPVSVYGQPAAALKSFAALAAPDARLLTIQPWDNSIINDIEKALLASDLGITPANDGVYIRLTLPEMSSQRREELAKVLSKKTEECKVAIRNVRKEFNNLIRDTYKKKEISENFFNRLSDVLQEVTDKFIKKTDQMNEKKKETLSS